MAQREIVVHAMKVTKRTGRVKYLSVSFTERSIPLADEFRQKLQSRLARMVRQHGRFEIKVRYREDWLVIFANSFPERELDAMLNEVATELSAKCLIPKLRDSTILSLYLIFCRLPQSNFFAVKSLSK